MEIESSLKDIGLTSNEAKVYLELTRSGEQSANALAKRMSMDRTLAYTVLNHLIDKGLVNYTIKTKKKFFRAADPSNLLNSIKQKEMLVQELVTELNKIQRIEMVETQINVYEGKAGMRSVTNLVLKYKEFCAFGATGRMYELFYEAPALVKELVKKKYRGRVIATPQYKGKQVTRIKNIETRYLKADSEVTTTIFGEYIMLHMIKEKPVAIVIKNKDIAKGYQNYFEILWKIAKR